MRLTEIDENIGRKYIPSCLEAMTGDYSRNYRLQYEQDLEMLIAHRDMMFKLIIDIQYHGLEHVLTGEEIERLHNSRFIKLEKYEITKEKKHESNKNKL
jgi:hypothetical protein